jgi:hypothetical protein
MRDRFEIPPSYREEILRTAFGDRRNAFFKASQGWQGQSGESQPAGRRYVPTVGMLDELTAVRWGRPDPELMDHIVCRQRGLIDRDGALTAAGRAVLDAYDRRAAHA